MEIRVQVGMKQPFIWRLFFKEDLLTLDTQLRLKLVTNKKKIFYV